MSVLCRTNGSWPAQNGSFTLFARAQSGADAEISFTYGGTGSDISGATLKVDPCRHPIGGRGIPAAAMGRMNAIATDIASLSQPDSLT